jgi:hypothetical protein
MGKGFHSGSSSSRDLEGWIVQEVMMCQGNIKCAPRHS